MTDQLLPFLIENRGVRGFAVRLESGLEAMFGWRKYPADVRQLLCEALAATPLLAADLPAGARFNLQFQGQRALKLLVTQINAELELRGMAKFEDGVAGDFHTLMNGGVLACLLESRAGADNYQATVEVVGESLAESLQVYFQRSEQLSTLIRLAVAPDSVTGLMLQRLPEKCSDDEWHHVYTMFQTLKEHELRDTDAEILLGRLFHEDSVRVFAPRPIRLQCRCSHAQISAMLLALGEAEVEEVLKEQGKVEVTCEFCGRVYAFSPLEVKALFAAAHAREKIGSAH